MPDLVIRSKVEKDDESSEPLYWSNELGWADRASATVFDAPPLYLPLDGELEEVTS